MSRMINRTTYEYRTTGNTPKFSAEEWLFNPDLTAVEGVEQKYWKVVGDDVLEMTEEEKNAVDAALEQDKQNRIKASVAKNMVGSNDDVTSPALRQFAEGNPIWTDSTTQLKAPMNVLLPLKNEVELLNPATNPLYVPGFKGVTERVQNLETILGKTGWARQLIEESAQYQPSNMLIFYAGLSTMNGYSGTQAEKNEQVAQNMARYKVIVLPNTIESPGHWDYANTTTILPRVKALNPCALLFGYIDTAISQAAFEAKVDAWSAIGVHGVFMDRVGYDFGDVSTNGRVAFNVKVDYAHTSGLVVMANCWNMDNVLGTAEDAAKPNATYNPEEVESSLNHNDWWLAESFAVNTQAYPLRPPENDPSNYALVADWSARGVKAIGHRATYGINLASAGIIQTGHADGNDLAQFHFISAAMFSFEAASISDHNYGASSASDFWWPRPDFSGLGRVKWLNPSVQLDLNDTDVYMRFTQFAKLSVDFSSGAQASSIEKW